MKFEGDIIILDPSYLSKDIFFGIGSDLSSILSKFSTSLWSTINQDSIRWKVSEIIDPQEIVSVESFVEDIEDAYYNFFKTPIKKNQEVLEKFINKRNTVGRFLTDRSSSIGVFYLDEIKEYNPKFLKKYGDWGYTVINNFLGDINFYTDKNGLLHIIGIGNITFYSNTVTWL